jgi:hypothetical protein
MRLRLPRFRFHIQAIMLLVFLVALILGGWLYVAGRRRSNAVRWRKVETHSASLWVEAKPVGRHALAFEAKAYNVDPWFRPVGHFWWRVEVSLCPEEGGHEDVWVHEFTEPANVVAVKQRAPIAMVLPERVVSDLPPGSYNIYVEVREDVPRSYLDGSREETSCIVGRSVMVNVEAGIPLLPAPDPVPPILPLRVFHWP